jgi:hypothetical protein
MSSFRKTIHHIGAACLLGAAVAIPAAAVEPEVELRCEFRPTRASLAMAESHRFRQANADELRAAIADELASRRNAERAEFAVSPVAFPVSPEAR